MDKGNQILELAKNADTVHFKATPQEKAGLLNLFCSNFLLNGGKVSYTYKKPFDILAEGLSCQINWISQFRQHYSLMKTGILQGII
jgi:hypothetical protein